MPSARRLQVGEIVEITTPQGRAYAHYVLRHKSKPAWGDLVRVLPGLYQTRPSNLVELTYEPSTLVRFFPVTRAAKDKVVQVVGFAEPTKGQEKMPTFRQLQLLCDDRRPRWNLWDGAGDRIVDTLTAMQRKFPRGPSACNLPALIEDILLCNGIVTPEKREWLNARLQTFKPLAAAFAEKGDFQSAANLYVELLDTHPSDRVLQEALTRASKK